MTPTAARAELRSLCKSIGPKATVSIVLQSEGADKGILSAFLRPRGWDTGQPVVNVKGDDFPSLIDALKLAWAAFEEQSAQATIRDMALEIIRITHEQGACTDAALRGGRFTPGEIDRLGGWACTRANEMAAGGPFRIALTSGGNGA